MSDRLPTTSNARISLPNLIEHLEPERLVKRHSKIICRMAVCWTHVDHICAEIRRTPRSCEELRQDLTKYPSLDTLATVSKELQLALALMPDRRVTQAAVAVLFDSRVRGPQNPHIYLEALTYDLADEEFPPAVVVAACEILRRESTFTPEIAEVIAACRKKLTSYQLVANLAGRLMKIREQIEEAFNSADADLRAEHRPWPQSNAQPGNSDWE
jgi:hypothetical protein